MYRSAPFIREFCERITATAAQVVTSWEIILVNDGSPDDALVVALAVQKDFPQVKVVDLSRNFGHHKAIMAGLSHAAGERVFLLDIDLEENPEWLVDFWQEMDKNGGDVVFGMQRERLGSPFRRWSGSLFYRLFNAVSETTIPVNGCTVRLMSLHYVKALMQLQDQNLFLAGNMTWIGFQQKTLSVEKKVRKESAYSLSKRIRLFWDGATSFSSQPLQLAFVIGLSISAITAILGIIFLLRKLISPEKTLSGYTSIILSVWFLGGLNILFIGVVGYYVARIFNEAKGRPQYIVNHVYQHAAITNKKA